MEAVETRRGDNLERADRREAVGMALERRPEEELEGPARGAVGDPHRVMAGTDCGLDTC